MDEIRKDPGSAGLSRRDMLRRGAVVGAAAVWTVPLVQVVSMTAAHAESPSAGTTNTPPGTTTSTPGTTTGTPGSTSSLASTGPEVPVAGGLAAGAAIVAVGAGLVAAARKRDNGAASSDQG